MIYMGSKSRIAKHIIPIILSNRKKNQWWVEPFVGGGNMIDKVKGKRIGYDINRYTIEALTDIRDNVYDLPKNNMQFTEIDYNKLKLNDEYKHKGYAGYTFSYGGKWLGGWRRDNKSITHPERVLIPDLRTQIRDYVQDAYNNAYKQHCKLQNAILEQSDYQSIKLPQNSLIYCDPPYKNTTKYSNNFDHKRFYRWCRIKAHQGHTIYISEYEMPKDFICVWQKDIHNNLAKQTGSKKRTEKLFTYTKMARKGNKEKTFLFF